MYDQNKVIKMLFVVRIAYQTLGHFLTLQDAKDFCNHREAANLYWEEVPNVGWYGFTEKLGADRYQIIVQEL